jgi:hypothetical protein
MQTDVIDGEDWLREMLVGDHLGYNVVRWGGFSWFETWEEILYLSRSLPRVLATRCKKR